MDRTKQKKLRQLMKEQKSLSSSAKINSPLARYNTLDQLSCAICNIPVKSNVLWTAHVQSKRHKETIAALKEQKETAAATAVEYDNTAKATEETSRKRKQNDATILVEIKKSKDDSDDEASPLAETKELEIEEASHDAEKESDNLDKTSLPADFFENQQSTTENNDNSEEQKEETEKKRSDSSSQLPQGFFDDPKADAKVRKVEYKDPELEEWEKFKKSMLEVNKVSDSIIDEEDDEAKVDREITELSEQFERYSKAELLRQKQELFLQKRAELKHQQVKVNSAVTSNPEESSSDSDNDEGLDEFLDWRSKVV